MVYISYLADDPPHNNEFHNLRNDRYAIGNDPSGRGPKDLYKMLHELCNLNIQYHFLHIDSNTDIMENRFNTELIKHGFRLHVHEIKDLDKLISVILKVINDNERK